MQRFPTKPDCTRLTVCPVTSTPLWGDPLVGMDRMNSELNQLPVSFRPLCLLNPLCCVPSSPLWTCDKHESFFLSVYFCLWKLPYTVFLDWLVLPRNTHFCFLGFYFMRMHVLPACMYTRWVPVNVRWGHQIHRIVVIDSCEQPWGCWEWNPCPARAAQVPNELSL